MGVLFERQRQREQQSVCAIDAQGAIELVREFDGFAGVAAPSRQRGRAMEWVEHLDHLP